MTRFTLIIKTFLHYWKANLLVALGVAICTAVLTGSLVIGDSVKYSLEQSAFSRLGETTHLLSVGDRYFRKDLAKEISLNSKIDVAPVLLLEGMAVADGGKDRVNKVQVIGVDSSFQRISGTSFFSALEGNNIIISSNLAERLNLKTGDQFLLRIKKASLIPLNAPFVSDAETSISLRVSIEDIADREHLGYFNLKNSQTAPYNAFLSLSRLNDLMKLGGKANNLLISAPDQSSTDLEQKIQQVFTPEDAELQIKEIPLTHEKEIVSERIFMEDAVVKPFEKVPGAQRVLTYFVNSIQQDGESSPYSFVTGMDGDSLEFNEIILSNWTAQDISARVGDSVRLRYYAVGPLRQLQEKEEFFIVKRIVPLEGQYADRDLMPYIPGLADAKSCKNWEAGVPINLNAIRDKDEDYWNRWKGTPKAFISLEKAQQIWSNRFGNYTAIRVPADLNETEFHKIFSQSIKPSDLGIILTQVKQIGLNAAKQGVDFSQLFIGLSFFLLVSAIILISLLFLLNLENRQSQIGTLSVLGFNHKQIRSILLMEGAFIAIAGGLIGLFITVLYTKFIFHELNTIWWSIVRTSVLEMKIIPSTLVTGFVVTVIISLTVIFYSVNRSLKKQTIELQRQSEKPSSERAVIIKKTVMLLSLGTAIFTAGFEILSKTGKDPGLFFLSGALLLLGFLLMIDLNFRKKNSKIFQDFKEKDFTRRNTFRSIGRSTTIIILFAIGTFLVISTGANRQDIFANAEDKGSGTGGFLYFAESTIPVLYDINDKARRSSEGLEENFTAVQFHRMSGDDASCLNLNKVTNPAILGVNPQKLQGRFSFDSKSAQLADENPWKALIPKTANIQKPASIKKIIPAIADQTVIQWSLGKKVGDTLFYRNEKGDTLGLELIAGLSPSIFQGYVIISDQEFIHNYPSTSGSNIFLFDGPTNHSKEIGEELKDVFRDYGWEMISCIQRLMEFNSVTNTYLSIFMALGALGLILGTVGLALVLARSILERKQEIALMQALGFTRHHLWRILSWEYLSLLMKGFLIGLIAAALAVWPSIASPQTGVSYSFILVIILLILINGVFWIALLSWTSLKRKELLSSLKN